jgi:hypothetical protein
MQLNQTLRVLDLESTMSVDGIMLLADALKVRGESGCSSNLLTELCVGVGLV